MSRILKIAVIVGLSTISLNSAATGTEIQEDRKGVSVDAKVLASPELTFQALRTMRENEPDCCKVLSTCDKESVIEEVFDGLPIIGKATCVYRETYEPTKKLSFKMIRSDKLKAFEGEWTLEPTDDGQHTLVRLRSYIDTGIKIPFAKRITELASISELKDQVDDLRKSAEQKQKQIASRAKSQSQ